MSICAILSNSSLIHSHYSFGEKRYDRQNSQVEKCDFIVLCNTVLNKVHKQIFF